jgi:hypothetical protein
LPVDTVREQREREIRKCKGLHGRRRWCQSFVAKKSIAPTIFIAISLQSRIIIFDSSASAASLPQKLSGPHISGPCRACPLLRQRGDVITVTLGLVKSISSLYGNYLTHQRYHHRQTNVGSLIDIRSGSAQSIVNECATLIAGSTKSRELCPEPI